MAKPTAEWAPRPIAAWCVRAALVIIPFIAGWLAIRLTQPYYLEPTALPRLLSWALQAITVSIATSIGTSRALRQLTPLPALLNMTLVFPDHAPSRFSLALRSGTTRKLLTDQDLQLSADAQEAAEQAIVLVNQLSTHERLTRGHTERVRAYADLIGQQLGLEPTELNQLRWGTLLHDVGKLKVPAKILSKPGAPTDEEWAVLRQHPAEAAAILQPFEPWLGRWILAASEHHERWDGTGYPLGLAGTNISLPGRITAVADAYDVITSRRSYKAPIPSEAARRELVDSAGTHFDPAIVRAMLEVGLDEQHRVNPFGWLLEIPGLARAIEVGVAVPIAALAAAAITAASIVAPPDTDLALIVEATTSTTSTTEQLATTIAATPSERETAEPTLETAVTTTAADRTTVSTTATTIGTSTTAAFSTATPTTATPTTATPTTAAPTTATTAAPTTTSTAVPTAPCKLATSGQTNLPNSDLSGCDFSGMTINGLNFSGSDLRNTNFSNTVIQNFVTDGANFVGADLTGASFTDGSFANSTLSNVDGSGLTLTRVSLDGVTWIGAGLNDANFNQVSLFFANFSSATFLRANISLAELVDATLTDANFSNATLTSVGFERSNMTRTNLSGSVFNSVTGVDAIHQDTVCPNGIPTDTTCFAAS